MAVVGLLTLQMLAWQYTEDLGRRVADAEARLASAPADVHVDWLAKRPAACGARGDADSAFLQEVARG